MKSTFSFLLILSAILSFSCNEFIEVSIDDKSIILLSPGKQAESANYDINFLWEKAENALQYQLQIASPNFTNVNLLYADTISEKTSFKISLEPGHYEWRVKALNGSSQTPYTTRSFTIYESDFEKQKVLLDYPMQNFLSADQEIRLEWQKVFRAEQYHLQVDTNNFQDVTKLLTDVIIENRTYLLRQLNDQVYQWRVQAVNGELESNWSENRSFTFDRTPPEKPGLITPTNNQNIKLPVNFVWTKVNDAEKYEIYIYKADSVTLYDGNYPLKTTSPSHIFNGEGITERIVWRVKAIDRAGNKSEFSPFYGLTIRN